MTRVTISELNEFHENIALLYFSDMAWHAIQTDRFGICLSGTGELG